MATFDLGRVTPLYKGDYSASASYELNDVVLYNGNLYWHVQAVATVGILPTDTTIWKLAFTDEGVRAEIRGYTDNAQNSADSALASKSAAAQSASQASASASQAALSAQTAQTAETGATASAQTASTKASEATASAQSAASSAQIATDKATLATNKAQAASESATLATAKASAAATSETNAVASAQTATTKASEAAASATSAQEYNESAQQSAVNAQTAQGLAETAQTAAETAQGLAEDARDLAQQYAESIDPENIYSAYPTDTASGAVASFADGANDIPLKSLVVNIDLVQSGSGDPSPDNVRPISGWTGMTVNANGTEIPISWESEAGTVYGGTLDVLTGRLTVTHKVIDLGSLTWSTAASSGRHTAPCPSDCITVANHVLMSAICSNYMTLIGNNVSNNDMSIGMINRGSLLINDSNLSNATPEDFTAAMTGVQLAYEIEPVTYQLTPHEVNSLLGSNTIYADTGDTAVEYRADTKAYINRKIAEAISALS